MTRWRMTGLSILILLLVACTPRIYGVPQDRWDTMSEQERIAAMDAYRAHQETQRQRQAEQARIQAMEKEAQLAREAEEAHLRQRRIDAIYRGQGRYGELIRVHLNGGRIKSHGTHRPYHALAFTLAAEEEKSVEVVNHLGQRVEMVVSYDGSNLLLDDTPQARHSTAIRLPFEDAWRDGKIYGNLSAGGPLQLQGVDVTVTIVGQSPPGHHGKRPPDPVFQPAPVDRPVSRPARPGVVVINKTPRQVKVTFHKGTLKLKKGRYPLTAKSLTLSVGQERLVTLHSPGGSLRLHLAYVDGEVLIDDAGARGKGTTRLDYEPEWHRGRKYMINNGGNRKLSDLELLVESVE